MSEHPADGPTFTGPSGFLDAVTAAIRAPTEIRRSGASAIYVFLPDLTAAETATFADLLGSFHQHGVEITLAEYQALKPKLVEIRSFRTRTLATWNGLTANAREADEIAYLNDLADVLRALLRDG